MIFDPEAIKNKLMQLDTILNKGDLLEKIVAHHISGEVRITKIPRIWEPGGGSTLFRLESETCKYLLKVKTSDVWVESKLESEQNFIRRSSLANEYEFLCYLGRLNVPWAPKLIFFEEAEGFQFIALEWLEPFSVTIENMGITSVIKCWEGLREAVQILYSNAIVHTDLHEYNLCFRGEQVVIIDFEEARFLRQEVLFEESLDVAGVNLYGNVGVFPTINGGISGFTCLDRMRRVFQSFVKRKIPAALNSCNFDQNCPFNLDTLQKTDSRIYQSLKFEGLEVEGQRPVVDRRLSLLGFLFKRIGSIRKPIQHLDIGSNLGSFCFNLSKIPCVLHSIGVEASSDFVEVSSALSFAYDLKKTEFYQKLCGDSSLSVIAPDTNVITMFSVYHHIAQKDVFLFDLQKLSVKYLIAEFATQNRFYPERGTLEAEIQYIRKVLNFNFAHKIAISEDYGRPIIVFSNIPINTVTKMVCSWAYSNNSTKNRISRLLSDPLSPIMRRLRSATVKIKHLTNSGHDTKNMLNSFNLAIKWVYNNSQSKEGICVYFGTLKTYPEVTGYYIPTLLNWGERQRAQDYARWLLTIQNADGSWSDPSGKTPYTFDTGQILKGLMAIFPICPEVESAIRRGCDWLLTQIEPTGRMVTPDKSSWGLPNAKMVSENIHIYTLEPLRDAGKQFNEPRYLEAVQRVLSHYLAMPDLTEFNTLSHFHAYVLEALIDLGYPERAAEGMRHIEKLQRADGSVPAYADVKWVCSTGLAQYAVIWYKLGLREPAQKAFNYLCRLQNSSGGFYGSYGRGANYFPDKEISWAVKYFLDAYYWHIRTAFDADVAIFPVTIDEVDGRLLALKRVLGSCQGMRVLDAGCGKGRFSRALQEADSSADYWGVDLSDAMLSFVPSSIHSRQGSLLNLPFADNTFDRVFSIEAVEHAVSPEISIRELCRVAKHGGKIVIIDKNQQNKGALTTESWERWFNGKEVENWLSQYCSDVHSEYIAYGKKVEPDGLFILWSGIKR